MTATASSSRNGRGAHGPSRKTAPRARKTATRNGGDGARPRDAEMLQIAIDLFYRQGFSATSMQDVADAMGMLKGSLYYYTNSKDALLRRIFDDNHAGASEIVERVRALPSPAVERLVTFLVEYAEWFLVNLERATLYQREWRYLSGDFHDEVSKQRAYYDTFLISLIDEATQEKSIEPDVSARRLSFFVLSAINGLPDWYQKGGSETPRSVAESYAVMALKAAGSTVDPAGLIAALPGAELSRPKGRRRARA